MRLDRRLQPINPYVALNPPHGVGHNAHIDHRRHMVIVRHPAFELVVQRVHVGLTDPDDRGADLGKPAYKIALRRWEGWFDEHDVHAGHAT